MEPIKSTVSAGTQRQHFAARWRRCGGGGAEGGGHQISVIRRLVTEWYIPAAVCLYDQGRVRLEHVE